MSAPVTASPLEQDLPAAFRLASELSHPICDCLYLAAALRVDTHVVTADRRFAQTCEKDESLRGRVRLLAGV